MKRCRRGHAMTARNSRPHRDHRTGKMYYCCRACESLCYKMRYHGDPAFREAMLTRGQAYKAARRAATRCEKIRT